MLPDFVTEADLTTLSGWIAFLVFVIIWKWNDAKNALTRLYRDKYADTTDRRESNQNLRTIEMESKLQDRATRAGMEWYERKAAIDILRDQLVHSREDFSDLQENQRDILTKLIEINHELKRSNSRMDGFLMLLSKLQDK